MPVRPKELAQWLDLKYSLPHAQTMLRSSTPSIASDLYKFDGDTRFKGETIMALIKAQHVVGKRYEWNVTEPNVHISGNTAWIAYVNKGRITDAFGTTNQKWLGIETNATQ